MAGTSSSKDNAFERIKEAIMNGDYLPGSPLPELKLSKELDMSRTPIREALVKLEFFGLVHNVPGKGMFVSEFGARDIREVYEILPPLEISSLKRIFELGLAQEIGAKLRKSITEQAEAAERNDRDLARLKGTEFHETIITAISNTRMESIWRLLRLQMEYLARLQMQTYSGQKIVTQYSHDHFSVIDALEAGDESRAIEAMRQHFDNQKLNLLNIALG